MNDDCINIVSLQRDGTSRQQRLLNALLPAYVAVDERKIEDLKAFVLDYAREIQYYDLQGNVDENAWSKIFNRKLSPDQRTDPHYALFMAFLQLFKIAQDDLNQITRRHLDFYYRDVLQLKEKKAVADQAFIILKLAKHVDQHLFKEGTQLKAGKDASGNELIYETDRNIVVNTAKVHDIKAVYKDEESRIYASPVANSTDGLGAEIETAEMNWRTFGKPEGTWPEQDRAQAEIGFAFASPILFLAEGDREITITLNLESLDATTNLTALLMNLDLQDVFRLRLSGEEDWIEPLIEEDTATGGEVPPATVERILTFLNSAESWEDIAGVEPQEGPVFDDPGTGYGDQIRDYDIGEATATEMLRFRNDELGAAGFAELEDVRKVDGVGEDKMNDLVYSFRNPRNTTTVNAESHRIIIKRTITKAQDPIVGYRKNEETLLDPFLTRWPVAKITLHTDHDPYIYETLQKVAVKSADISVHVSEIRELIIQNDQSVLDPSKNFQPFGIRPEIGSSFYIGNREVFSKQLEMLKVRLKWHGLPDDAGGFDNYYEDYIDNDRDNESFKSNIYLLDNKSWIALETDHTVGTPPSLFSSDSTGDLESHRTLSIENIESLQKVKRDIDLEDFDAYDTNTRKGFLKLELTGTDFGHKDFQPSYADKVLKGFKEDGTFDTGVSLPNEPYTPELKEIFLNYRSSAEIELHIDTSEDQLEEKVEQFFHVGAFGVAEQTEKASGTEGSAAVSLFPEYTSEGSLYIGLADFAAGQSLSLLLQVAEGSANPEFEPQPVQWSYLSDNDWVDFDKFDILSDGTNGLLTSGIIRFDISKKATSHNTLLPVGMHWLRATVDENTDAVSDLINIIAQAVPAVFKNQDNDPDHLKEALPAETISKLKVADSGIDEIMQPYASFGGKTQERKSAFYTRVSERLRHKSRAITIWDYERLVLEQFPSVYKVKCLNHTRYTGSFNDYSELAPGQVTLIVISNVKNKNAVDPLRPKTSLITLSNIHDFITGRNAECADLHVKNPVYEEIQVKFNVKFHTGYDNGFYGKQLEDDLKAFLSPWAFEASSELVFGGKIHKSIILNHVEERPYVDFITCFEMYHIIKNPGTGAVVSRTKIDEAQASTAVSILGSAGQVNSYGDHTITVLETDDCACKDNEILPTATIASVDDCPTDQDQMFET